MPDHKEENGGDPDFFISALGELGLKPTERQLDQFRIYFDLLTEYNKVMNLTAITDFREVYIKHFIDSLMIVKLFPSMQFDTLLDMGTGAGFPGIPIGIMFTDINIVLVDSLQKRVGFLDKVAEACGLSQIRAVHSRAEDFCKEEISRETYDICVSRAVARLNVLEEYCLPYVKVNGYMLSYKSASVSDEINEAAKAAKILGGRIEENPEVFVLPGTDIQRTLIRIRKVHDTNKIYPRKAGLPAKKPL